MITFWITREPLVGVQVKMKRREFLFIFSSPYEKNLAESEIEFKENKPTNQPSSPSCNKVISFLLFSFGGVVLVITGYSF